MPLGAKSRRRRRPAAEAGGHSHPRAFAPGAWLSAGERILFVGRKPFHACDSCKPDVGHIHTALCARIGMSRTEPRPCRISKRTRSRTRSEEHTSELQSLMRISYAVFCLNKQKPKQYTS